jgi:pyruvate/2-oxoglutarate dehydrogenase complex dihydrolipoamide dehydrogenase (E3) component
MRDFDFLVLGGGSAGYAAASAASALGLRVGLVEGAGELGGLCILRGCMPSKALIESANHFADFHRAGEFGLSAGATGFSISKIHERKARHVAEFADYRAKQLASGRFELIRGWASFVDPHTVEVKSAEGEPRRYSAETILIATGSRIKKVAIPGLEETGYWTSDTVLATASLPRSVIVLGGGATAVEFAHYFSAMGAKTTVIQRSQQLVKEMDADVAKVLTTALRQRGVSVHCNTALLRAERTETGLKRIVYTQGGETRVAEAEEIVYALGREPLTAGMALENAGLDCTHGCPSTGLTQQTNVPHIFAAGDVCGPYEVVHIAIAQAEVAARNALRLVKADGRTLEEMDYRLRLFVIFTEPEMARVGMSESELQSAGIPYRVASYPFDDHGKSILMEEKLGFVKLLAGQDSDEIVGAAVVGPRASELIHELVVAMRFRATAGQLSAIPHYHPTLSEIWTYPAEELASGMP